MESKTTKTTKIYFWSALTSFLIITAIYLSGIKPMNSYKSHLVADTLSEYDTKNYTNTFIYFIVLFVIQICIGWSVVNATECKIVKDKGRVLGEVLKSTALPWLFIFGFSLVVILLKPKFKSVFSNVYGYFIVKATANSILTDLLKNEKEVKAVAATAAIGTVAGTTGASAQDIQNTADAILKICGNTGMLINQITPSNFLDYMKMLQPLMKENYSTEDVNAKITEDNHIFYKLFQVVEIRERIGECAWYIYTGLFVIAIVSYNIAMIPCR
jgi:hypothetical protein